MRWGPAARLILAAALAGIVLPQLVIAGGSFSMAALAGACAIGFAGGLLVRTPRWLAVIPVAAAIGVVARCVAAIELSPFGIDAGVPASSIVAIVACVTALHALMAMSAAMVALVAIHLPGWS